MPYFLNAISEWWSGFYSKFHLNFIKEDRYMMLVDGLKLTLGIALLAIALGIIVGFLVASMKLSKFRVLNFIANAYIDIIRGTPVVTQLLIINFVVFASVTVPKFFVAVIAFGINSGAYVAEIIRAGIMSVDKGQTEAGRSLGLSSASTMMYIIVPQAVKNIIPALANEFIVLVKETAIVGYIALADLAKAGDVIRSRTYDAFMPLIATAVIYFVLIKILTLIIGKFEKYLRKSDVR